MRLLLLSWSICVLCVLFPYASWYSFLLQVYCSGFNGIWVFGFGWWEFERNEGRGCVGWEVLSRAVVYEGSGCVLSRAVV